MVDRHDECDRCGGGGDVGSAGPQRPNRHQSCGAMFGIEGAQSVTRAHDLYGAAQE